MLDLVRCGGRDEERHRPTVYVRTEMDALTVKENTGLPYASKVTVKRADGEVGVMHACGHDLHMTVFLGTAKVLAESKGQWSGTVVLIGQPAEKMVSGAKAMSGSRIGSARFAGLCGGASRVNRGSHACGRGFSRHHYPWLRRPRCTPSYDQGPHPDCLGMVVFLQTIVSREMDPLQPTVVTVGSFHAGTKHNIIPDDAHLQLTVRTMNRVQREKVLAAVKRATNGISEAAGVPADRAPIIEVSKNSVPQRSTTGINPPCGRSARKISWQRERGAGTARYGQRGFQLVRAHRSQSTHRDVLSWCGGPGEIEGIERSRNSLADTALERVCTVAGAGNPDGREGDDQRSDGPVEEAVSGRKWL